MTSPSTSTSSPSAPRSGGAGRRPLRSSAPEARRGSVGPGLPRAAERQRAVQEGRQPAQRAGPHREHLRPPWLLLHRRRRPARAVPLVRPLHPAQAGPRRRQDRRPGAGGARRRVLHDAGAHRRRAAHHRAAARHRRGQHDVRPRHRRRHRPAERAVPLDPHRGRPGDLGEAGGRRAGHHGGLRRLPADHPGLPRRRRRGRRDHRRHAGAGGDQAPLHRRPGVRQPAAQVQDRDHRPPRLGRLPRGQRRVVRRHHAPRARTRLRPLGRRRAVHEPDAGPEARRLDPARRGRRRVGGRDLGVPGLRLPPAALARPPQVPGGGLGRGAVPRGPRDQVPRPPAGRLRLPADPRAHR